MRVKTMRNLVLAVGGVLLITTGIVLAAVMAITPSQPPGIIGPAVQVGPATATSSGTSTPAATRSTPTTSRPAATPTGEDHVHSVSPSPAVQVTDDHGGGRRSGRHGD